MSNNNRHSSSVRTPGRRLLPIRTGKSVRVIKRTPTPSLPRANPTVTAVSSVSTVPNTTQQPNDTTHGKTIINVNCSDCGRRNIPPVCPVFDSLGYPYYPIYAPLPVNWCTNSPLAYGSAVPLPCFTTYPALPPVSEYGCQVACQSPPSAYQFRQLYPPFGSNLMCR